MLNRQVVTMKNTQDAACLGAAIVAGYGYGAFDSIADTALKFAKSTGFTIRTREPGGLRPAAKKIRSADPGDEGIYGGSWQNKINRKNCLTGSSPPLKFSPPHRGEAFRYHGLLAPPAGRFCFFDGFFIKNVKTLDISFVYILKCQDFLTSLTEQKGAFSHGTFGLILFGLSIYLQ